MRPWILRATRLAVLALALLAACRGHAPHWSYEGPTGPERWADLDPAWRVAREGQAQSPIDIVEPVPAERPQALVVRHATTRVRLVHNGHTVQLDCDGGSSIELDGETYELVQLHFHSPSEHRLGGASYPLELHLVHRGPGGRLAVIGLLFRSGAEHKGLARFFGRLPARPGRADTDETLDLALFGAGAGARYAYDGSLTTPPCSEGVRWIVIKAPAEASAGQLAAFQAVFSNNARPPQPLHGRVVREHSP